MKVRTVRDGLGQVCGLAFDCPGCGTRHAVNTVGPQAWSFNGDFERPTLSPSVLVRRGHYANPDGQPGNCACDFQQRFPNEAPWPWPCTRCHSFVREGRIQFLEDCTHALKGQTVDLPDCSEKTQP